MPRRRNPPELKLKPERRHANGSVERAVWVIKYFDEAKRRQAVVSTGFCADESGEAERFFAGWLAERTSQEPADLNRRLGEIPLAEVLAHYIDHRINIGPISRHRPLARPKDVLAYVVDLIEWWGDKTVEEVNQKTCDAFASRCASPQSARARLEYLRGAIRMAHEDGLIPAVVNVPLPRKAAPRTDYLERSDVAKLIWHCMTHRKPYTHGARRSENTGKVGQVVKTKSRPRRHLARYALIATYTGTRSGRIFSASFIRQAGRPWIDLERGIYYRSAPGEDVAPNKQAPTCRIPKRLLRHMRRWYRNGQRYPVEFNGGPIQDSKALNRVLKELFPDRQLVPHSFRHTAATWLMRRSELSVHDIAGFLGMSLEMLERVYGHHRTHHQTAIDDAISTGGIGKIDRDRREGDQWTYREHAPRDTMRNDPKHARSTPINDNQAAERSALEA